MDEAEEAVREFELDLLGAESRHPVAPPPHGMRIETKPQYADLLGRLLPGRKAKPMTSQALEVLAIIALKQAGGDRRHQCHPRHRERLDG